MAKSDEVFIYIKALGAGETKRDIDNVARSLDKLSKKTDQNTRSLNDNSKAQSQNNAGTARANQLLDQRQGNLSRVTRTQNEFNKLLKVMNTADSGFISRQERIANSLTKRESRLRQLDRTSDVMARKEIRRAQSTERMLATISERGWQQQERIAKKYRTRLDKITGSGGRGGGRRRGIGSGGHVFRHHALRMAGIGALFGTAIEVIPMITTGLNSIGAAGLAAANGLAPLVGILGGIAPAILSLASVGTVLGMAFAGFGKAIGGDAKALAEFGPNAQQFAKAITDVGKPMQGLRRGVQETFMRGLGPELRSLVDVYLPKLHTHLQTVANDMNIAGRGFSSWLRSGDGTNIMGQIFDSNENAIARFSQAGTSLLQLFLRIGAAAGPMFTNMAEDFMNWTSGLNEAARDNPGGLAGFFNKGYGRFKEVVAVLGDFAVGIYNVVSAADPLTSWLGDWITNLASSFREWTGSAEGQKRITQYFEDMKAPFSAVVRLVGAFAKGLFEISNNPNFMRVVDKISGELIPGLVDIFNNVDATPFIDAWIKIFDALEKFVAGGGLESLGAIANSLAGMLNAIVGFWAGLPGPLKHLILSGLLTAYLVPGALGALVGGITGGGRGGRGGGAGGGGKLAGFGPAALLAPAAIAGGAAMIYEQMRVKGTGMAQGQVNAAVANGSLGSIFGANARPTGGQAIGPDGTANSLNRFGANKGFNATINDFVEKSFIGNIWSALTGSKTSWDIEKEKWAEVDNALRDLPLDVAADQFEQIRLKAEALGVPAETLINELFPQFRDRLFELDPGMRKVGISAEEMAARMGGASTILLEALAFLEGKDWSIGQQPLTEEDIDAGGGLRLGNREITPFFSGGIASAGKLGLAGEIGPELAFNRNGGMSILGLNGPELFKPSSDLGILPTSALHGGGFGNAPDWAINSLRGAASGVGRLSSGIAQSTNQPAQVVHQSAKVVVENASSNVDVEKAVKKAFKDMARENKERK